MSSLLAGRRSVALCITVLALAATAASASRLAIPARAYQSGFAPGARVLLDAHNAYPERGRWADRLDRALATGTPIAIEQDLFWSRPRRESSYTSVVAHDDDALAGAPTLRTHFFERIRPLMEQALVENRRETWPLVVLNLDFKDNLPPHLDYVWSLLGEYESWLTTALRSPIADRVEPFEIGPLLVLAGSDTAQRRRFHHDVPVGSRLRMFGAIRPAPVAGKTKAQRTRRAMRMTAAQHIDVPADNFARWVNFPWSVIEEGGQNNAGSWIAQDSIRLESFVRQAHEQQLFIRFYTLDGFAVSRDRGYSADYNFGTVGAARARWQAVIAAGVDFVATDQYAEFAELRAARLSR